MAWWQQDGALTCWLKGPNHLSEQGGPYLDDGCDELLQEGVLQQRRPVVMEEVDEKPFDVGAVLILVQTAVKPLAQLVPSPTNVKQPQLT